LIKLATDKKFSSKIQPIFESLIGGDNPLEQIQAAYELGNLAGEEGVQDALIQGLIIPNSEVKLTILDILCQPDFFSPEIVAPIGALIDDSDSEVRAHAVELLGTTKEKSAVIHLVRALNDKNPTVRYNSMASLANIGDTDACAPLSKCLKSENWEDRYNAVDAMGMLANKDYTKQLAEILKDPEPKVRENAALSVVFYNYPPIEDGLLDLLEDPHPEVIAAAVYTLGQFKSKKAVKPIIELLKSDIDDLTIGICETLSRIKDPAAIPALINVLDHPLQEISIAAKEALDVFQNIELFEPMIDAIMNDRKIVYVRHRLKDYTDQKIDRDMLKELKLPIWVEELLRELIIIESESKSN
jgi:HEAT repeat protein